MLLARRALVRLGAATTRLPCRSSPASSLAASELPSRPLSMMHRSAPLRPTLPRQSPLSTSSTSLVAAARATKQPSPSPSPPEDEGGEEFFDEDLDLGPDDEDDEEAPADEEADDGGTPWGKAALAVARSILDDDTGDSSELSLWSFKAYPASKRVEVRLDKLTDRYGSPSLDDVSSFSRKFAELLAEALGEEEAGEIEVEASSAGAARRLRLPRDLERFLEMPLAVSPKAGSAAAETIPKPHPAPLRAVSIRGGGGRGGESGDDGEEATVVFATADVRVTRGGRGRLTKKQLEARFEVSVSDLDKVTLYVDV